MSPIPQIAPEFSRLVSILKLGGHPAVYQIEASETERAALAQRFGLVGLARLAADVTLRRAGGGAIRVSGTLTAELTQSCVATLEPVPEQLSEAFSILYRPDLDEAEADRLAIEQPDEEDLEPLVGDAIDIGEAVAQQMAVLMDPFPRAPGAPVVELYDDDEAGAPTAAKNPFAALSALKKS